MANEKSKPVVIVTGASRGLGAAVTRLLVKYGANVVLNGRSHDALQEVAAALPPGRAAIVSGDVSEKETAVTWLALYAPPELSGKFISWDDPAVL
jgi:NADP-dependent 3-hydroxy acid dehydrogenase YdfG